jgi:hypothetical protein
MCGKLLGFVAAAALLISIGAANAQDPIKLTNGQLDKVTAGGVTPSLDFSKQINSTSNNNVNFNAYSDIQHNYMKQAYIDVFSKVKGNSSTLDFDNEAIGKNSNVQGTLSQISVAGQGSSQTGSFVSAANGRVSAPMVK